MKDNPKNEDEIDNVDNNIKNKSKSITAPDDSSPIVSDNEFENDWF